MRQKGRPVIFRKIGLFLISVTLAAWFFVSCGGDTAAPQSQPPFTTKNTNDRGGETLAQLAESLGDPTVLDCGVAPVENIASFPEKYLDDYIRGVDLSSLIEVESVGGKFYDNDQCNVGDVMELLSYYGINWVRIRLWNDPFTADGLSYGGGGDDIKTVIAIGRRAKQWGMKVLLDFHYSDFWASPGQQARPKAWVDYQTADDLAPVLKTWTKDVLYVMSSQGGFLPDMVQIGNETNDGFCGFRDQGGLENTKLNEKKLLAAGLEAVREISAEYKYPIRTMLHAASSMATIDHYMGIMLQDPALDFDVIGFSYYPDSYGNRDDFDAGLANLAAKYKKPLCMAEYQTPFTNQNGYGSGSSSYSNDNARSFVDTGTDRTLSGQAQIIRNMNSDIMNCTESDGVTYGIGAFWWEAAWLPLPGTGWRGANSREWYTMDLPGKPATAWVDYPVRVSCANQAFFSFNGTALPSLNVFLQMMGKAAR